MASTFPLSWLALAAAVAAPAAASEDAGAGSLLVPMEVLEVPIVEGPRADGRLRVRLVLRATDAAAAARIGAAQPAMREAAFLALSDFARLYASPFAPVDARRLATSLDAALRVRDRGLRDVLVVEVAAFRG